MNKEEVISKVEGCLTDYTSEKRAKTGRWIFVDDAHEHARCSECGYGDVDLLDGRPHNYCPNCGSFMM